jgi:hypothetical protein
LLTLTPSISPGDGTVVTSQQPLYIDLDTIAKYFSALTLNDSLNQASLNFKQQVDRLTGTRRGDVKVDTSFEIFADAIVVHANTEAVDANGPPILIHVEVDLYIGTTAPADTANPFRLQKVYLSDRDTAITFSDLQNSTVNSPPYTIVIKELNPPEGANPAISPPIRAIKVNGMMKEIKTLPAPALVVVGPIVASYVNNQEVDATVTLTSAAGPGAVIKAILVRVTSNVTVELPNTAVTIPVSDAIAYTVKMPTANLASGNYYVKFTAPASSSYLPNSQQKETSLGASNSVTVNPSSLINAFEMQFLSQGNQPKLTFIADTKVPTFLTLTLIDKATGQRIGLTPAVPGATLPPAVVLPSAPAGLPQSYKASVDATPIFAEFANLTQGVTFTLSATATDSSQLSQQQTFTLTIGGVSNSPNPAVARFITSLNTAIANPNNNTAKHQSINVGNILTTGISTVLKLLGIR